MSILFFLTMLRASEVRAGQAFNNCIGNTIGFSNGTYSNLLNFSWNNNAIINNNSWLNVCCAGLNCSSSSSCSSGSLVFHCVKTYADQKIFCSNIAGCGGIVGNDPITTNVTIGNCTGDNPNLLINVIRDSNETADKGYAGAYCNEVNVCNNVNCFWDNGGWICIYPRVSNVNNSLNNTCFLEWTAYWPGNSSNNPLLLNSTINISSSSTHSASSTKSPATITSSTNINPNNNSSNNPNLTEIIAPIGTVVGVVSIGGLTAYYLRKKKHLKANRKQEIELAEINRELLTAERDEEEQLPNLEENLFSQSEVNNEQLANTPREEKKSFDWEQLFTDIQKEVNYLQSLSVEQLTKLEEENIGLTEKLKYYQPIQTKEKELNDLKESYINKASTYEDIEEKLEEILKFQEEIDTNNIKLAYELRDKAREKLLRKTNLTKEEIDSFCKLQSEIIRSKINLSQLKRRLSKEEIKQITNLTVNANNGSFVNAGSINFAGRSNTFNLGSRQNDLEITELAETNAFIEQPTRK